MGRRRPARCRILFSPDRKGEHPQSHLADFEGILQADAYAGFKSSTKRPRRQGHAFARPPVGPLRRDFHDVWKASGSPIAKEALDQIGALYDIEREITGRPAERRQCARRQPAAGRGLRPGARPATASRERRSARAMRYASRLGCLHPVPRGWPCRHRQQCRRARHSARCIGRKIFIRGLRMPGARRSPTR